MQTLLKISQALLLFVIIAKAKEKLSWSTRDREIRSSIFVPDDLPDGQEENRVLPWVFHDENEKDMQLKCIILGYNTSQNSSDAIWSHPGFNDSQVDTSFPPIQDNVELYKIWLYKTLYVQLYIKILTC